MPPQYDSLLAKLVVSGTSRAETLDRLRGALARCEIGGVATTLPVHAALAVYYCFDQLATHRATVERD